MADTETRNGSSDPAVDASGIDAQDYREVLTRFATGVTVVTTLEPAEGGDQPWGTTVNSFTGISLDPPLVMVSIGRERSIHPIIERTGRFAVNILGEDSQAISDCFAGAPSPLPRSAFCNADYAAERAGSAGARRGDRLPVVRGRPRNRGGRPHDVSRAGRRDRLSRRGRLAAALLPPPLPVDRARGDGRPARPARHASADCSDLHVRAADPRQRHRRPLHGRGRRPAAGDAARRDLGRRGGLERRSGRSSARRSASTSSTRAAMPARAGTCATASAATCSSTTCSRSSTRWASRRSTSSASRWAR